MVMVATGSETKSDDHIGGYDPDRMTADERLDEVAGILAAGLLRMRRQVGEKRRFAGRNCLEVSRRKRPHGAELIGGR
jgi:hypothetical protein